MNRKVVAAVLMIVSSLAGHAAFAETEEVSRIAIIAAMQNEVQMLIDRAEIDHTDEAGGITFHVGRLCGKDVVIVKAGIGKILAAAGTAALFNRYNISSLIFTGVAGGVMDDTQVLDVVIGESLVQHDYGVIGTDGFHWVPAESSADGYYASDAALVELAYQSAVEILGAEHVFRGVIATGDQFVASGSCVQWLQEQFNAMACEMEGASVAAVCCQYEVPFVVIRTMSDKADGAAVSTFEDMQDTAADNSCRIVLKMLESMD